jgi:hypothetical protein
MPDDAGAERGADAADADRVGIRAVRRGTAGAMLDESMDSSDLTVKILGEIRDEIRTTRSELRDELGARIDETNVRLERLEQRVVASEIRVATALTDVAGTVREVRDRLDDALHLRDRVSQCERDIADLKRRSP